MRRKKIRSWFFISRKLKPSERKEKSFYLGLIAGATAVTCLTLLFVLFLEPPPAGRMLGVKRLGGEMCQEKSCFAYERQKPKEPDCVMGQRTACTSVLLIIEASRRLVVNEAGEIIRIYSNTTPQITDFRVFASFQDGGKEEVPITAAIWEQYSKLEAKINWEKRGLVYEYKPSLAKKAWSGIQNLFKTTLSPEEELQTKQVSANIR